MTHLQRLTFLCYISPDCLTAEIHEKCRVFNAFRGLDFFWGGGAYYYLLVLFVCFGFFFFFWHVYVCVVMCQTHIWVGRRGACGHVTPKVDTGFLRAHPSHYY